MRQLKHFWQRFGRFTLTMLAGLVVLGLLFGKNLFLQLVLPTNTDPLEPPTISCQLQNWPPASEAKAKTVFAYEVGQNKLTSVLTGHPEKWVPIKSYVITHSEGMILVDPGPDRRRLGLLKDAAYNGLINHLVNPIRLASFKRIDQQIDETEIVPEVIDGRPVTANLLARDVRTVIVNHAHSDHTGNLDLFPQAETIMNQLEYEPALAQGSQVGAHPKELARATKIRTVSLAETPPIATFAHGLDLFGDQTIFLVDLPGHTPGQTGVLVRTDQKTFLLSSDALARAEDLEEMAAMPGQYNRRQFLESLAQIDCFRKSVPDAVILPGHDEAIGNRLKNEQSAD